MSDNLFLFSCFLCVTVLGGCTTTQSEEAITINRTLISHDGIVLLSNLIDSTVEYSDKDVDRCLGKWIREVKPKVKFVDAQEFREQLYPYFSASTAPHTVVEYKNFLNNQLVKERIKSMHVRYLIVQQEANTSQDYHGGILPIGGAQAAGFFGLLWWNRHTAFNAYIWDLNTGEQTGKIKVQAKGTGILPAFILPIPLYLPATEKASCKELAKHIASALPME